MKLRDDTPGIMDIPPQILQHCALLRELQGETEKCIYPLDNELQSVIQAFLNNGTIPWGTRSLLACRYHGVDGIEEAVDSHLRIHATIYLSHLEQMQYVCMMIKDIQVHLSDLMIKGGSPKVIVNTITRHIAVPVPVTTHYGHH